MTVDWDEELRKLNASQYGKRQERDLTKDMNDPEAVKWARKNAKIAQSAVEKSTNQVIVFYIHVLLHEPSGARTND